MSQKKVSDVFVSALAVVHNDEDIIESFFADAHGVLESTYENYELVVVDDGSTDGTGEKIGALLKKYDCSRYLRLSRSFGMEDALCAGLDTVIGDVIVTLEPECDPPQLVPKMVDRVRKSEGVVYGVKKGGRNPLYYSAGKAFFHWASRAFLDFSPPKGAGYFLGFSRQTLNAVISIKDKAKFIRIFGSKVGFSRNTLPYAPQYRRSRSRQKRFFESAGYALDAIVSNSTKPLRIVTYTGLAAAFLNVLYMGYVAAVALYNDRVVEGWTTLSLQSAVMFFLLFTILAVFSEYLLRLVEESKQQPNYYIAEERQSSVMIRGESARRNVYSESE